MQDLLAQFESQNPEIVFEWHDNETEAKGWVVINSLRGGAAGGGTRMRKNLDKREVVSLAKTMEIKFSIAFAHRHYYDLEPVTSNYINFQVNSPSTPYMEDSLRVYINGVRLNSEYNVYVPNNTVSTWTSNRFTPSHLAGTFALATAINASDIIRIDFDVAVT